MHKLKCGVNDTLLSVNISFSFETIKMINIKEVKTATRSYRTQCLIP